MVVAPSPDRAGILAVQRRDKGDGGKKLLIIFLYKLLNSEEFQTV